MASYHYPAGSDENYSKFGVRLWFNRLMDDTVSPVRYLGYRDLGNIVVAGFNSAIEFMEHYSARTGTRVKDRKATKEISLEIPFTFDEINKDNLALVLRGGVPAAVAGDTSEAVSGEIVKLVGTETAILAYKGHGATSIVVTTMADGATVKDTDWEEVSILGGYKGIKRKSGSATIADGDYVKVAYTGTIRAHQVFYPATSSEIKGKAALFAVGSNNEFLCDFQLAQIDPDGEFSLDSENWTEMKCKLTILDNSGSVPTMPYGKVEHFGVGGDLALGTIGAS